MGLVGVGGVAGPERGPLGEDPPQDRHPARGGLIMAWGLAPAAGPASQVPGDWARCQHASSSAQRVSILSPRARSGSSPLRHTARRRWAMRRGASTVRSVAGSRGRDGEQPGWAFDDHVANVGRGRGDQAAEFHRPVVNPALDPAGAGAGFARARPAIRPRPANHHRGAAASPGPEMCGIPLGAGRTNQIASRLRSTPNGRSAWPECRVASASFHTLASAVLRLRYAALICSSITIIRSSRPPETQPVIMYRSRTERAATN